MALTGTGVFVSLCLCSFTALAAGESYENVAVTEGRTCRQSSMHNEAYDRCNAANNNTGGTYQQENCIHTRVLSSDSGLDKTPWWEVNLTRVYPVHNITVWGRTRQIFRLYPFSITVDTQQCTNASFEDGRKRSVECNSVLYGQVVRLTRYSSSNDFSLNLCELQIWVPSGVSQCPAGQWGSQCGQRCSDHCGKGPGKNFCYQDTGVCYDGCTGNFAGHFCEDCKDGYHGNQCNQTCSSITARCTNCTKDGQCTACSGHFMHPNCTDCKDGFHGNQCNQACSSITARCTNCTKDGLCTSCSGHFMHPSCTACILHTYGQNCNEKCGQCKGGQPCNTTTGECTEGCQPGYTGLLCDTECEQGLYGEKCNQTCGKCQNNTACHHETGHCNSGCEPGYIGSRCVTSSENTDEDTDSLVGPIVGAILGVSIIVAIIITAIICWRRRSESSKYTGSDPSAAPPTTTRDPDPSPIRQSALNEDNTYSEIRDPDDNYEIPDVTSNYDKLTPYSNDDANREPYMQMTSRVHDVKMTSSASEYVNT